MASDWVGAHGCAPLQEFDVLLPPALCRLPSAFPQGVLTMPSPLFHLSFPVGNIPDTKAFYVSGLGCQAGRENATAIVLDLYGHQLVAHVTDEPLTPQKGIYPRHFGLIFQTETAWETLFNRVEHQQLTFYQSVKRRFPDSPLEHRTFFLADPFHNLLEFKYYVYPEAIFGERSLVHIGDS
jgi:extradiol dioxygenase family protein